MKWDDPNDLASRWLGIAMTASATIAIEQALCQPDQSRALLLASTLGVFVVPMIGGCLWIDSRRRRQGLEGKPSWSPMLVLLLAWSLPMLATVVLAAFRQQSLTPEVALMRSLRNLGIALTCMAGQKAFGRLASLVGLFVVTIALPVAGEAGPPVLLPTVLFGLLGALWLARTYQAATGDSPRRRAPLGARIGFGLTFLAMAGAVSLVGSGRAATLLAELVPTSGGTGENNPDARSGVGDGDNEVSASEDPQSVGFTESEKYLETDRPSLYDAFNESYGEPFKPKTQERMIALAPNSNVRERDERPRENLQAGREFSAVRRAPQPENRRPSQRDAKALVYVSGPTPLHLPLTAFSHFDGTTWREEPCCAQNLGAEPDGSSGWLKLAWANREHLAGHVACQIKVGLLDSSPLPIPSLVTRFKVGSVDRPEFFSWAQFGIVRMSDRKVPAGTVIDCEHRTIDPDKLRRLVFLPLAENTHDHHIGFGADYRIPEELKALALKWTAGLPEGWATVQAVLDRLRSDYVHDRHATVPEGTQDTVAHFLLESRRGPDYLFAGAAAVLLRSLGYPVRVVSGLYASPERFDPWTGHTPVLREDVHFWIEVKTPGGLWITSEPTPGYELLPPSHSWSEILAKQWAVAWRWVKANAWPLSISTGLLALLVIFRRQLLDAIATFYLLHHAPADPRRRVLRTIWLLERRALWGGLARPPHMTLANWSATVVSPVDASSGQALRRIVRWADWALHAPETSRSALQAIEDVPGACRDALAIWTRRRFRTPIP